MIFEPRFLICTIKKDIAHMYNVSISLALKSCPQGAAFIIGWWVFNKPSSVPQSGDNHLSRLAVTCKLKRHNPEGSAGNFIPSLFGLAPDGVYLASLLPDCWCALTAPFHPYLLTQAVHISVALSLRSPSPDVIRHPALWSSDFPHLA